MMITYVCLAQTTRQPLTKSETILVKSLWKQTPKENLEGREWNCGLSGAVWVGRVINIITGLNSLDSNVRADFLARFYKKHLETDKIEYSFRSTQSDVNTLKPGFLSVSSRSKSI